MKVLLLYVCFETYKIFGPYPKTSAPKNLNFRFIREKTPKYLSSHVELVCDHFKGPAGVLETFFNEKIWKVGHKNILPYFLAYQLTLSIQQLTFSPNKTRKKLAFELVRCLDLSVLNCFSTEANRKWIELF